MLGEGGRGWGFFSLKYFHILILRLYIDSELPMYPGSGKKVCVVVVVVACKPILVFSFGPNQINDTGTKPNNLDKFGLI